jgi:putative proteasome-type protease
MTYCLAIKLKTGIVGLADTRLTSGNEFSTARKVTVHQRDRHSLFIMTSGLRSVRDKAITYFNETIEDGTANFDKMYKAVNAIAAQVRSVAREDKAALSESGLFFNLYAIIGGQLENDHEPKLYLLYPEGNWVEVGQSSPYFIIGNYGYGKPVLVRSLTYESSIEFALKTGFLSFDATRLSCNDVGYPIDVLIYENDSFNILEHRFEEHDLIDISKEWNKGVTESINRMPDDWMQPILTKVNQNHLRATDSYFSH